jgi:hypothetical protein
MLFILDEIESASKSQKHFNDGFFTMPNSRSKYSTNVVPQQKTDCETHPCCCKRIEPPPKPRRSNCKCDKGNDESPKQNIKVITNGLEEKRRAITKKFQPAPEDDSENDCDESTENRELTVTDLYKIIMDQTKQLIVLQNRVDQLLVSKRRPPKKMNTVSAQHSRIQILENNVTNIQSNEELQKISIGVMTSFELVMHSEEPTSRTDEGVQTSHFSDDLGLLERKLRLLDGIKKTTFPDVAMRDLGNFKTSTKNFTNNECTDVSCMATESLMMKLQGSHSPTISPQPSIHVNVDDYSELVYNVLFRCCLF